MVKLKSLSFHNLDGVPDDIIEEMTQACIKLGEVMAPVIDKMEPNIAVNALNWSHTAILRILIADKREELEKAAKLAAWNIMKNMEILIKQMEDDQNKQ